MERLSRLAHRIVWVNPRVTARGFAPRPAAWRPRCRTATRSSAAKLQALEEVAEAMAANLAADSAPGASWKPPEPPPVTPEPTWASASPTEAQKPVPMPSGYGPSEHNTTA